MKDLRKNMVWVRFSDKELEALKQRMSETSMANMSAYVRKMCLNGYLIQLDLSDLKEVRRLLSISSNNINQYAKRANEKGSIYLEDIKEIQKNQAELWVMLKNIMDSLSFVK